MLLAVVAKVVASGWLALVVAAEVLAVVEIGALAVGDIVLLAAVEVVGLTFGDVELLV